MRKFIDLPDKYWVRAGLATWLTSLVLTQSANAGPWLPPGDIWIKSDVQLLADAGVITSPISSWPLSWGDIAQDLNGISPDHVLTPAEELALARMRLLAREALIVNEPRIEARLSFAEKPMQIRDFQSGPRGDSEAGARVEWTGERFALGIEGSSVSNDDFDDQNGRLDNSYVAVSVGNWMLAASTIERWWGPGWSGSMILSNNARPIPALVIERNFSKPFDNWFRWLGPWSTSVIWGQLERNRAVPDARYFGWRVNFKPLPSLEIGLLRSAQWCGSGRECDLDAFAKVLVGDSNLDEGVEFDVANQLAGVDFRWAVPFGGRPFAVYGQFIGEDEAGNLPSKFLGQLGVEVNGYRPSRGLIWRAYAEISDSTCRFYSSEPQFNCAYNNGNYPSGYRYRDRAIGFAADNDTRAIAVGAIINDAELGQWVVSARNMRVNRGGETDVLQTVSPVAAKILDIDIRHRRQVQFVDVTVGVGADRRETNGESRTDLRAYAEFSIKL